MRWFGAAIWMKASAAQVTDVASIIAPIMSLEDAATDNNYGHGASIKSHALSVSLVVYDAAPGSRFGFDRL